MKLLKVKRRGESAWHYALQAEVRPACGCGCGSPRKPKRRGDAAVGTGICGCQCHRYGLLFSLSLCEKLAQKNGRLEDALRARVDRQNAQLGLFGPAAGQKPILNSESKIDRVPWSVVAGGPKGCQVCRKLAAQLTRGDLQWLIESLEK